MDDLAAAGKEAFTQSRGLCIHQPCVTVMKTLRQPTHKEERFILSYGSRKWCWLVFYHTAKVVEEKGTSVETLRKCLHNITLQASL